MKSDELKAWRQRLSLGEAGMAAYLGVPVTTYRKWENGTRSQDASTLRLFDVLQLIEDEQESPGGLHDRLTGKARAAGPADAPKRKPGRKPRAAPPTDHERLTYKGRCICDEQEMREGYCGSCSLETHVEQMRDPESWVQSSVERWTAAAKATPAVPQPIFDTHATEIPAWMMRQHGEG